MLATKGQGTRGRGDTGTRGRGETRKKLFDIGHLTFVICHFRCFLK